MQEPDWDGRVFCNGCGRPNQGMPDRCTHCRNNEFSLREHVIYWGWLRRNQPKQVSLFEEGNEWKQQ